VEPCGREVDLIRAPGHQGPVRPPRGELRARERRRREDVGARPDDDNRAAQRRRYDDPGAGLSHAPPAKVMGEFDDFHRRLEAVLQGVPERMWVRIQDEGILEQCIVLSAELWTLTRRAAVAGAVMTGRLPPGPEGPRASGVPPPERGPSVGALEAP
jgi:hypothetical protein